MNSSNQEKHILNELEKEDHKYGDRKRTRKKMVPYKRDHSKSEYLQLIEQEEDEDNDSQYL